MKKALVVLIGVLMAVMFAAESNAETTVGGTIDVRGRWRENNNDVNKDLYGSTAYWDQKVNVWVDAKVAEGLKGYIELQSDGSKGWQNWGSTRTTGTAAPNSLLNENQSYGAMEIRYAYIDFMIPSTPVGIKIGHQPFVLGHSIWANTQIWGSDGLVIYSMPIKQLMIGLGALKGYETGSNTNRTDADLYVLMANYTFIPKNTVGFNASYIRRDGAANNNALPNAYWQNLAGTSGTGTVNVQDRATTFSSTGTSAEGNFFTTERENGTSGVGLFTALNDIRLWNIMLTMDGAFDLGLSYKFEFDQQLGKLDAVRTEKLDKSGSVSDVSASGFAVLAGADFKIGTIAKVGADFAYGSGDKCVDWGTRARRVGDGCTQTGNEFEGYLNFNDYGYTMIYEDIVGQKMRRGVRVGDTYTTGLTNVDFGLYNTMYVKVGAGVTPLKDMSVDLNIYKLRADKPRYYNQSKDLGWEADLILGYNIYKNLKLTFMAGYFDPGDHYRAITENNDNGVVDYTRSDPAWAFEQKLSLKF